MRHCSTRQGSGPDLPDPTAGWTYNGTCTQGYAHQLHMQDAFTCAHRPAARLTREQNHELARLRSLCLNTSFRSNANCMTCDGRRISHVQGEVKAVFFRLVVPDDRSKILVQDLPQVLCSRLSADACALA